MSTRKRKSVTDTNTDKSSICARTDEQREYIKKIIQNDIIICCGRSGSGKTCVAAGVGADYLKRGLVDHLIISRPCIGTEDLGYLPGELEDKINPYLQPLFTELDQFINVKQAIAQNKIKILPVSYMRGVSFKNSFIIVDECLSANTLISTDFSGNSQPLKKTIQSIYNDFSKGKDNYVLSFNEKDLIIERKKVISVFKKENKNTKKIYIENRKNPINITSSHPIYIYKDGLISCEMVDNLSIGDQICRFAKPNSNNALILNEKYFDIWLGFILGDGSLSFVKNKYSETCRLSKTHGLDQKDYCGFSKSILNGSDRNGLISGYTGKPLCGMITQSYFIDENFKNCVFNKEKKITKEIEQHFTLRTLALWYMDDGSKFTGNNGARFHTESFSLDENIILKDILFNKFGLKSDIKKYKKYYYISLDKENYLKLISLIKSYIHPSMAYKINSDGECFDISLYEEKHNNCITLSTITNIKDGDTIDVYNIEVEDNNNYFADNLLVHNCQNLNERQLRMILTRFGENSKMVLTGDTTQSDLNYKESKDLQKIIRKLGDIATPENKIAIVELTISVRHPLIDKIESVLNT